MGENLDNFVQTASGIYGNVALAGLGAGAGLSRAGTTVLTSGVNGASAMGSSISNAYNSGATDSEATLYGAISGTSSAIVNLLAGGLSKSVDAMGISSGVGRIDDKVAQALTQKIGNQLIKNVSQAGIKAGGEGLESVLQGIIDAGAKKITYMKESEIKDLIKDEKLMDRFIKGAVTSGVLQAKGVYNATKNGQNYVTGLTNEEQKTLDDEVNNQINFIENEGTKLSNSQKQKLRENARQNIIYNRQNIQQKENDNNANEEKKEDEYTPYEEFGKEIDKKIQNGELEELNTHNKNNSSDELIKEIQNKTRNKQEGKEDVEIIPINDILSLRESGGYDSESEYNALFNNIRENGIKNPIELVRDKNGNVKIYNGNHRLQIANELGLNEVPIKYIKDDYVDKFDENLYNENIRKDYIGGKYNGTNRDLEETSGYASRMWNEDENDRYDIGKPENRRATKTDDRIPYRVQGNNNRPSSNSTRSEDNLQDTKGQIKSRYNERGLQLSGLNTSTDANNIPNTNGNVKSDISNNSNMQINENNTKEQNIAPIKNNETTIKKGQKNTIDLPISDKVKKINFEKSIKEDSKNISSKINKILSSSDSSSDDLPDLKLRKWIETATESDVVDGKLVVDDFDTLKSVYEVKSNSKALYSANKHIEEYGYKQSIEDFNTKLNSKKNNISVDDIVMGERLVSEAIKNNDYETAQSLIEDISIMGTELGQRVQSLSVIQRLTPEGQLRMLTKTVKRAKDKGNFAFKDVEITPEMAQKILETYNQDGTWNQDNLDSAVEDVKQDIANQLKSSPLDKIDEWRYLSMLGNPKTHIRNTIGNVAMKGATKVKNAIARTIEDVAPIKNRTKTWRKDSDDVKSYAKQVTEEMKSDIMGQSKYSTETEIERMKNTFKSKTLNKLSNLNSKALEHEDWLFSKNAFKDSFQEYLTANGIKTQDDIENNVKIVNNARLYALDQAEQATFRQYSQLASTISDIENQSSLAHFATGAIMPYKKVPINVAKTGVKYSPIGLAKSISYDAYQVKNGNMEASQMIDNLSQGLTGTSLALIGYGLAKAGFIKGSGDNDKETKYDDNLGSQDYSLKIGDKYYSLSWLSPSAMPLLSGATVYEQLEEKNGWDMNVVTDMLSKTLDPLSEMSFISSLDDVLSSYDSGGNKLATVGKKMTQNYITQFFPTLFSQLASTLDDKKRSTKASSNSSWKDFDETYRKIMYKIPGLRNKLEPATDIWGNEKEQTENIVKRSLESFILPYNKTTDISSKLDNEIKRIYNQTGDTKVIPSIPYSYVNYDGVKHIMSAEEYTRYKKDYGQTANNYINNLLKDSRYSSSNDDEKAKMIEEIYDYARATANRQYFSKQGDNYYESNYLTELKNMEKLKMSDSQKVEYIATKVKGNSIKNDKNLTSSEKKKQIGNLIVDTDFNDSQIAHIYSKFYSKEKSLNVIKNLNIPLKTYIQFDIQDFKSDKDLSGNTISGSKKKKILNYIKSTNLNSNQKIILTKLKYNSYDEYNNQIIKYIKGLNIDSKSKQEILEAMGFKISNGKITWK